MSNPPSPSPTRPAARAEEGEEAFALMREELERARESNADLLTACKSLMQRMESNELVNRPADPCNHYDQPAYDAARASVAKAEGKSHAK